MKTKKEQARRGLAVDNKDEGRLCTSVAGGSKTMKTGKKKKKKTGRPRGWMEVESVKINKDRGPH